MIQYNMRERGPYEYDKFVLNILQLHNMISLSESYELEENNEDYNTLLNMIKQANFMYNSLFGTEDILGICESIYKHTFNFKE